MFGGDWTPPEKARATIYRITHSSRDHVRGIMRCAGCGLGVLPPWLHNDTASAYAQGEDPWYLQQAPERIANARHLLSLAPDGGRLLEVGCACGFLLVAARERGSTVQGIEPSAWAAAYARKEYKLDVFEGTLGQAPFAPGSFDVVVLADVIEHLTEPRAVVKAIHRLLAPGGRVLIYTPDLGSLLPRVLGAHWWGLLDDHYFYFNRGNLTRFLESEGFEIERLTSLGRQFPLSHWAYKVAQYNAPLEKVAQGVLGVLHLGKVRLTIDFHDEMACLARKR
jgi:SAM-dependent methyltransferase